MEHRRIMLVDADENYLFLLEYMLMKSMGDTLDVMLISDKAYFEHVFQNPMRLDVLVIHESFWQPEYQKHDIKHVFLLSEDATRKGRSKSGVYIYRYANVDEILNPVSVVLKELCESEEVKTCKTIVVYSPQGGSGKTTIALGLTSAIGEMGGKALYVNLEDLQVFGDLVGTKRVMDAKLISQLSDGKVTADALRANIEHRQFDYLLPIQYALPTYGLNEASFLHVVEMEHETQDYHYMILDTTSAFNQEKLKLFQQADYVLIPVCPDPIGQSKLQSLLQSLDTNDQQKFHFVLNRVRDKDETPSIAGVMFREVLSEIDPDDLIDANQIHRSGVFQGLAYFFLNERSTGSV